MKISETTWKGKYIILTSIPDKKRKTNIWHIESKYGGFLGMVKWFPRWRKYAFFPETNCVFEEICMKDISDFIIERTKEYKVKINDCNHS